MTDVQLNCLWYIAILGTIWLCENEWIVFCKIINVK